MYQTPASYQHNKPERNPDDWITGTEAMNIEQKIYLKALSEEVGETYDDSISKATAIERIKMLEQKAGKKQ